MPTKETSESPKEEEKQFALALKRGSQQLANTIIQERTNSMQIGEKMIAELADLLIEGKDVDPYLQKIDEQNPPETEQPEVNEQQQSPVVNLTLEGGHKYIGTVKNGKPHGSGKMIYAVKFIGENHMN